MEVIGTLVKSYLGVGVLLLALQTGWIPVMPEPECPGGVAHVLTDRYFPGTDMVTQLHKTRTGEKDINDMSLLLRVGLHAARWAPDYAQEVVMGEMTTSDFLRGGSRCTTIGAIPSGWLPIR